MTTSGKGPEFKLASLLGACLLLTACATPDPSTFDVDTLPREGQIRTQLASASLPEGLRRQIPRLFSRDPVVRASAAAHLGRKGQQAAAAVPYLIRLLPDTTPVQLSIYLGSGYYSSTETTPAEEASRALSGIGSPASNALLLALRDPRPVVRRLAAKALGQIGELGAVDFLVDLLRDPDPGVRATTAIALGDYHNPMAAQKIMDAYAGAGPEVRTDIIYILGNIGDVLSVPFLIGHAQDTHDANRAAIMLALGKLRDARGVATLLQGLQDSNENTRANAAYALAAYYSPEVIQALIGALADKAAGVREAAQGSLETLSGMDFAGDQTKWAMWWQQQLRAMQPAK